MPDTEDSENNVKLKEDQEIMKYVFSKYEYFRGEMLGERRYSLVEAEIDIHVGTCGTKGYDF